jgi:hypothetical protein
VGAGEVRRDAADFLRMRREYEAMHEEEQAQMQAH